MYAVAHGATAEGVRQMAALLAKADTGGRRDLGHVNAECFAAMRALAGATLYECGKVRMVSATVGGTTFLGTMIVE